MCKYLNIKRILVISSLLQPAPQSVMTVVAGLQQRFKQTTWRELFQPDIRLLY